MGLPAFQASGLISSGIATANTTPSWPTHQAGDLAILSCFRQPSTYGTFPALVTASGFRFLGYSIGQNISGGGTNGFVSFFWCIATSGSMASPVIDHNNIGATSCHIHTYRGVDLTLPVSFHTTRSQFGPGTSYGTGFNLPARIIDNTLISVVIVIAGTSISCSAQSATGMTSVTERADLRGGNAEFCVTTAVHSVDSPGPMNIALSSSTSPAGAMLSIYPPRPTVAGLDPYYLVGGS